MAYELKPYQDVAVYDETDGILPNILRFLKSDKYQRLFVLKSIMGSGKTIIASECIEALLESDDPARTNKELCVIWLSKGNAGLHMQSSEKLARAIKSKDIHVYGIKDSADFNADRFNDKDVYVINWEKINNLKDGELVNNLFVESENKNLRLALRNSKDVEFVIFIDEFHLNYNTASYKKIIDFFNPHVIIGMSATPSDSQMTAADFKYTVPVEDVKAEGMVKKGVCFNTASDYSDNEISQYDTLDEFFLRLALRQRNILEEKYRNEGSDIIPLLLIQFNDDKKNEDIIRVKDILDREYDNNRHNDYAIWISEADNKKDKLRSPDNVIANLDSNAVKILLFKQAIATGWDCPRAHVLLKYRRVATKKDANTISSFDIQTIGRIFRMPEPNRFADKNYKHYDDDDLNYGYVYVPENSYILEKAFEQAYGDTIPKKTVKVSYESDSNQSAETQPAEPSESSKIEEQPRNTENYTAQKPDISVPSVSKKELNPIPSAQTDASDYGTIYGPAIIKAEEILSKVNLVARDEKPDADDINKAIKKLMAEINVDTLKPSDSHEGRITFEGKII